MSVYVSIFMLVVLLFALVYTLMIGKSQKSFSNEQYERNRFRNLVLLTFIYIISILGAAILLYDYIQDI